MEGEWRTRFSLAGIRQATTMPQEALLHKAVRALEADDRVRGAWLAGSFAAGRADAFSDLDLHCYVRGAIFAQLDVEAWKPLVHAFTPTVMASTFPGGQVGGYALTPEWIHIDLSVHSENDLEFPAGRPVIPLFDRVARVPTIPGSPIAEGDPYFPADAVDLYFYLFGKMVAVVARNEPLLLNNGVVAERDLCLTQLFYAERGLRHSGGAKRVRPFLTAEQYGTLVSLPAIDGTLDRCIEACLALARVFVARGRVLADRTGAIWPYGLERATVEHVERNLGVSTGIEPRGRGG
jgi:hypothetical protein